MTLYQVIGPAGLDYALDSIWTKREDAEARVELLHRKAYEHEEEYLKELIDRQTTPQPSHWKPLTQQLKEFQDRGIAGWDEDQHTISEVELDDMSLLKLPETK